VQESWWLFCSKISSIFQLLDATAHVEGLPYYHELNVQRQRVFDSILLDQRHKEGKAVARLRKALIDRAADVTATDLVEFLDSFVEQVAKDWEVEASLHPRLRVFILRALFPLVWPSCSSLLAQDMQTVAADAELAQRMPKLRNLTPAQMDLDPLVREMREDR
jgi:hypothetical protein